MMNKLTRLFPKLLSNIEASDIPAMCRPGSYAFIQFNLVYNYDWNKASCFMLSVSCTIFDIMSVDVNLGFVKA